jgi:transcriptional regulator with XRE-family HTH domain
MDVRVQFGRLLRALRMERQLTQEELAFRAGMDVSYLSDLERGRWNPSLAMLVDLSVALRLHPSDLLKDLTVGSGNDMPTRKRPQK